ncbi:MAG: DEAD/DEAH box helicase family protein [Burkholderiaceae bacterium]
MLDLRDYQTESVDQIRELIRQGKKNILLVSPTGSGKTVIATHMVGETSRKGNRATFVVDRLSLIDQTSRMFYAEDINHGVIQGDHHNYAPWELVQVASQQTLARRKWPDSNVIFVDEAHTITKTVKQRLHPRDTVAIGMTATPFSKGLGVLYDAVVNVTTTNKLIADGHLSNYRIFAPSEPDMTGVKVIAGEWEEKEAAKRALEVVGDCVAEYLKRGNGQKFICSAVNVDHVMELQRQFMASGIVCATYTYKDLADDRADIVEEFRKPDSNIRGLITVTAASKGFDVPDIGVVIMARPLRTSLAEHIQFFGRGLRTSPGKQECLVLDHSGNCRRFWDEWNDFFETGAVELDDGKKKKKEPKKAAKKEREMVACPKCKHLHLAMPHCPACGYEYPARAAVAHVPGTLQELVASHNRAAITNQLWPQVCAHARVKREDPQAARKLALALFKNMTGVWPAKDFEDTAPQPVTREVANKIKSMNIAWVKGRKSQGAMHA